MLGGSIFGCELKSQQSIYVFPDFGPIAVEFKSHRQLSFSFLCATLSISIVFLEVI